MRRAWKLLRWHLAVWWRGRHAHRRYGWIDCPVCPGGELVG